MTPPPTSQGPPTGQAPGHSGHSQPAPWLQEQQESGGYWGTGVKGTGQRVSGERPRPGKHTHPSERAVCVAPSPALGLRSGVSRAPPGQVCTEGLRLKCLNPTLRPLGHQSHSLRRKRGLDAVQKWFIDRSASAASRCKVVGVGRAVPDGSQLFWHAWASALMSRAGPCRLSQLRV